MTYSKTFIHLACFATCLATALPAAAQAPEAPAQASEPATAAATPPSVPPPASQAAPLPGCRLGNHAGIEEEDAATAATLVCREVEQRGAPSGHHYRVDLDKLGSSVYVTLSDEDGGSSASRRLRLTSIEETGDAAPRLAEALLTNKTLSQTSRVGNLTEAEARAPLRKSGALQGSVGVLGVYAPGVPTLAPGFELSLRYDTPSWVAHTTLRYAAHFNGDEGLRAFDWGVGGRYMLSDTDFSPFVGGGLAFMAIERNLDSQSGLGAFGEIGVEALRLHKSRLGVALRADAPLFSVANRYVMPLSLAATFTF
ncbi:MAG: hypothetical protein QM756_47455 [Polyangiaceae bacterium]